MYTSISLKKILQQVAGQSLTVADAMKRLRRFPYDDLGTLKRDTHRTLRKGYPEAIYGEGKSTDQLLRLAKHMHQQGEDILITRAMKTPIIR